MPIFSILRLNSIVLEPTCFKSIVHIHLQIFSLINNLLCRQIQLTSSTDRQESTLEKRKFLKSSLNFSSTELEHEHCLFIYFISKRNKRKSFEVV